MAGTSSFIPFSSSLVGGATAVNVFATFCTVSLFSVALRVAWLAIRCCKRRDSERPQEYVFFHTQLGNYAACLLVAMTFNTVAGILALPWLVMRGIRLGPACTAQAFLIQTGTWSSAFFTVSIAIHTFNSLVLRRRQSLLLSRSMMGFGWALSGIMASLPFFIPKNNGQPIYGEDGLMCGFRDIYPQLRFFLHLLPILVASVLSVILYSLIFLMLRGTLTIKGGVHLTLDPKERWNNTDGDNYHRFVARVAQSMIWYPVAYVALLVPYSILRLLQLSGFSVPFQALVFASTCWFMLAVVNVALLYNTFRILGPAFDARSHASTRRDIESFVPSTFVDKHYSTTFAGGQRVTLEKVRRHHAPIPSYSSNESESGLLASHRREDGNHIIFGSLDQSDGREGIISSPERSMGKVEALAHSPQNSISDTNPPPLRHVRIPSFTPSPLSADGRIERHHPSSPVELTSPHIASPTLQRSLSSVLADVPSQPHHHHPSLPQRQLTLLASRSASCNSWRPSPENSPETSLRPFLRFTDESRLFANPRMPPTPPTAMSRFR